LTLRTRPYRRESWIYIQTISDKGESRQLSVAYPHLKNHLEALARRLPALRLRRLRDRPIFYCEADGAQAVVIGKLKLTSGQEVIVSVDYTCGKHGSCMVYSSDMDRHQSPLEFFHLTRQPRRRDGELKLPTADRRSVDSLLDSTPLVEFIDLAHYVQHAPEG
jgi:hypothetical protein